MNASKKARPKACRFKSKYRLSFFHKVAERSIVCVTAVHAEEFYDWKFKLPNCVQYCVNSTAGARHKSYSSYLVGELGLHVAQQQGKKPYETLMQ